MTDSNAALLLDIAIDLANSLKNQDRFERLLSTVRKAIRSEAVALMGYHRGVLTPLAIQGLRRGVLGRRFNIKEHPRLKAICESQLVMRFPDQCDFPDPFDGLMLGDDVALEVHSCMGLPLYSDDELIGILTLDSIRPGVFEEVSDNTIEILAALSAATLKTALELDSLTNAALHAEKVVSELTLEAFLRDGGELIGQSDKMRKLKSDIQLLATSDYTALVLGETGVGKELVARTIHQQSLRKRMPMVYVNCAALPESLAESELFGHIKGAFTGADKERPGKFLLANGGTIFLDEIGEMPLNVQSKLLRVLQNGEVQSLGSDKIEHVDVRVIAATNRNLVREVDNGNFRSDLYHRLSIYPITVPPLRDRKDDVALLANFFLERTCVKLGLRQLVLSKEALHVLQNYHWPGNVRELEHIINRAGLLAKRDHNNSQIAQLTMQYFDLPTNTPHDDSETSEKDQNKHITERQLNLRQATDKFQKKMISNVLMQCEFNWSRAANKLGMDRANLVRLSKRLSLKVEKNIASSDKS